MPSIQSNIQAGKDAREQGRLISVPQPELTKPIPVADYPASPNSYSRTPLPSTYVDRADTQRHWQSGAVPQQRIPPISATSNPVVGSQAASQAIQVVETTPGPAGSGTSQNIAIQLSMPLQYNVAGSPAGATGDFIVTWLPEPAGTFLGAPGISAATFVDNFSVTSASGTFVSISTTPQQNGQDFAMVFTSENSTFSPSLFNPGGAWSNFYSSAGIDSGYSQQLSNFNTISASGSITNTASWSSLIILLPTPSGAAAVINNSNIGSGSLNGTNAGVIATPTAGNTLLVVMFANTSSSSAARITACSDTLGNTYFPIANAANATNGGSGISAWISHNVAGGADTVSAVVANAGAGNVVVFEISGLSTVQGLPDFRAILGSDLPLPTTSTIGAVFANAGTTHQFFTALGANGKFTLAQPAASDLSNGTTGSGAVVLANSPGLSGAPTTPTLTLTAATPTTGAGDVGLGTTTGFGTGSAGTAVTTTTKGGGTGPTTPQTVVNYLEIDVAGTKFWIPLVQ